MVVPENRKSATVTNMIILRGVVRKSGDIQNVRKIVKDPMSEREAVTADKVLGRVPSVKFVSLRKAVVKLT